MGERELVVTGAGVVTDGYEDVLALAQAVGARPAFAAMAGRAEIMDPAAVESQDFLAQLAIRAVHQAWTMGGLSSPLPIAAAERVGLIYVSAWGTIDSTAAYLDSMLEAEGRYASPRHFSRSVYSAGASAVAIHFGIKGACETMTFDEDAAQGARAVTGALRQAWRLLARGRCERVVVVWADQGGDLAEDLVRRAAQDLHRREYERYVREGLGFGAVAVVLEAAERAGGIRVLLNGEDGGEDERLRGKPYPTDAAVSFLERVARDA